MQRNQLIHFGLSEFASRGASWLVMFILPFYISAINYGEINLYYSGVLIISSILLLGQDRIILTAQQNQMEVHIESALFLIFFCSIVILIICFVFFSRSDILIEVILVVFISSMFAINKLALNYYRCKEFYKKYSTTKLCYAVQRLIFVIVLAPMGVISYLVSEFIALIYYIYYFIKIFNFKKIHVGQVKNLFSLGFPLGIHGVVANFAAYFDRYLIAFYLDIQLLASYSMIHVISSSINFIYTAQSIVYERRLYINSSKKTLFVNAVRLTHTMLISGLVSAIFIVLIFYSAMQYNTNLQKYNIDFNVFCLVLFSYLIMPVYMVSCFVLMFLKESASIFKVTIIFSAVKTILFIIYIPKYQLTAASIVNLTTNLFMCLTIAAIAKAKINRMDAI